MNLYQFRVVEKIPRNPGGFSFETLAPFRYYCVCTPIAFFDDWLRPTYHLQSIAVNQIDSGGNVINGTAEISGIGGYGTFAVKAQLSNGQTEDVTTKATWQLAPPTDNISTSGQAQMLSAMRVTPGPKNQLQTVDPGVCTWAWSTGDYKTYGYAVKPFKLTVTYQGMTAYAYVAVASSSPCYTPTSPAPAGTESGYGWPD